MSDLNQLVAEWLKIADAGDRAALSPVLNNIERERLQAAAMIRRDCAWALQEALKQ